MLERDLADQFTSIFETYPLLIPNNAAQAGWPDRFVQLPDSRIIATELKVAEVNSHHYFVLNTFRQTQAAWMAKWQRNGGLGFLFVGVKFNGKRIGYHIITCDHWQSWLKVNITRYYLDKIVLHMDYESVRQWFDYFIEQSSDKGVAYNAPIRHGTNSFQSR
jgi:hypothetical protein